MKNLKQKACCKLSLEDFPVASTPLIWASMLVGKPVKEMIRRFMQSPRSLRWSKSRKMFLVRKIVPKSIRIFIGDKIFPKVFPQENVSRYLKEMSIPTILDETKSWTNGIPGYNIKKNKITWVKRWIDVIGNEEEERKILVNIRKEHKLQVKKLFQILQKRQHRLIFFYDNWLDIAGHIEWGRKWKITEKYLEVNTLVGEIRNMLNLKQDVLYIISDHGMKLLGNRGDHSNYGFFSSSTGETIKKPYEIYYLIKRRLNNSESFLNGLRHR